MRLKITLIIAAFALVIPLGAYALSPSSILVSVAPENPAPEEEVTITLNSYAADLNSVSISWLVGGKNVSSGIGLKTFKVKAPAAGAELRVTAMLDLPDGKLEKMILLRPTVMALLWQANDAYVPPFYRGKALPTLGSEIKIVAIPEIKTSAGGVNPKNMVYSWKKDYSNDAGASGYGKNYYIFTQDYLEDANNIGVVAATTDGRYSSAGEMTVRVFDPKILFYKVDSALGTIWEYALGNGYRIAGEEILEAAPYFVSPSDVRLPSLIWEWSINGTYVGVEGVLPNVLPVRAQPGASGTSSIKVELSNKYKLFMSAEKEIRVEF